MAQEARLDYLPEIFCFVLRDLGGFRLAAR